MTKAMDMWNDLIYNDFDNTEVQYWNNEPYFVISIDDCEYVYDISVFPNTGEFGTDNFSFPIAADKDLDWHLSKLYKLCQQDAFSIHI